ncbi:capsular biosynthesis protein [Nitrospirillum sp. BR 11828]|uniref:capsular biosynthesis protein n=1 Tax=Nitrospirillum sp. BR 11828 TaxID=3104325 RepID=UPI002ACA77A0|nr:capsular biosynthesis protein [Nitrospirillum sp. BR 11828]MDZ5650605.1 capsular biosynthesis protein [Nitrospirillum sp. BR 11828]
MIAHTNVLVVDVDGTLCPIKVAGQSYADIPPEPLLVGRLRELAAEGWRIILHSARGMRTHDGNLGTINLDTLPTLLDWLKRHEVPYHEVHMGKPWPGDNGFYIDDRAVRPREFLERSLAELDALCERDRLAKAAGGAECQE